NRLPPELAKKDAEAERLIVRSLAAVIDEGVMSGVFRTVEPRSAALAVIGMCMWTGWWVAPDETGKADIVEQIADQAVASVRAADTGASRADSGSLLRTIRESVDQLERVIET
ncbi:MAG TPA: hypothetical protein VFZ89_12550, partial [Solirubrobacteraceae bacterium]